MKEIKSGTVPSHGGTETVRTQHNSGKPSQNASNPNGTEPLGSGVNAAFVKCYFCSLSSTVACHMPVSFHRLFSRYITNVKEKLDGFLRPEERIT